jgi:hypothetical protein
MERMKSLPLKQLLLYIYPNLYPIHTNFDSDYEWPIPVQLSFANIERSGVYLLDTYDNLFIYICKSVHPQWLADVFNVTQWALIPDDSDEPSNTANINNHLQQANKVQINAMAANAQNAPQPQIRNLRPVVPLPQLENMTSKRIHAFINKLISDRPFKPNFHILR